MGRPNTDSLLVVLAQRLVRRLCPHCRTTRPARDEEIDELLHDWLHAFPDGMAPPADEARAEWLARHGVEGRLLGHSAPGCAQCEGTGLRGRAALHELMSVTRDSRRLIQTRARAEEIQRQAMADGMRTLRQDGIEKVLAGVNHDRRGARHRQRLRPRLRARRARTAEGGARLARRAQRDSRTSAPSSASR